jgi:hypothetical protein
MYSGQERGPETITFDPASQVTLTAASQPEPIVRGRGMCYDTFLKENVHSNSCPEVVSKFQPPTIKPGIGHTRTIEIV